ncbi:MAG: hypothetical protein HC810_01420 [Acaryochloridaceae cyanobacterium RL_2_7]|nr:hypothetical protein [Acaryochloridaceae cyanobacterium RL_2_7]
MFEAQRLGVLYHRYLEVQEIFLIGENLPQAVRQTLEQYFSGQHPSKQISPQAKQSIINETNQYYSQIFNRNSEPDALVWQTIRNQRLLTHFPDLVGPSQPQISNQQQQGVIRAPKKPSAVNRVENSPVDADDSPRQKPMAPSERELVLSQFQRELTSNALERLQENRSEWNNTLNDFLGLKANDPGFQQFRDAIAQDQQLAQIQTRLEGEYNARTTTLGQVSVGGLGPFGSPAKDGLAKIQQEADALKVQIADVKAVRATLRQQFPALSVLQTQSINPTEISANELLDQVITGFEAVEQSMNDVQARLTAGKFPLHTLSNGLIAQTLNELGFDESELKIVEDWLSSQNRLDEVREIGGALGTVTLSVGAFFTTGGVSMALQVGAAVAGVGTAVYEFQRADVFAEAGQASIGGKALTDVSLEEARGMQVLAWANLAIGTLELAAASKAVSQSLKGTELAEILTNSKSAEFLAQLDPKQMKQVLQGLQDRWNGIEPQFSEAYRELQKQLNPPTLDEVKDFWNWVVREDQVTFLPDGTFAIKSGPELPDFSQPKAIETGDIVSTTSKKTGKVTLNPDYGKVSNFVQSATDSTTLGNNLEGLAKQLGQAGKPVPKGLIKPGDGYAAHHIVQGGSNATDAKLARQLLTEYQIDINDAANGVWLPKDGNVSLKEVPHENVHTETYRANVLRDLKRAEARPGANGGPATFSERRQNIINELNNIRQQLLEGKYSYKNVSQELNQSNEQVAQASQPQISRASSDSAFAPMPGDLVMLNEHVNSVLSTEPQRPSNSQVKISSSEFSIRLTALPVINRRLMLLNWLGKLPKNKENVL